MMWCVRGLLRSLFGWEEAEPETRRSTYDQPSYSYHSEREFQAERVRLLARYNIIPTGDGYIQTIPPTTSSPISRINSQTATTAPYKSTTKTVEKPKVSVSPASTLKLDSSSPKPPPYNCHSASQSSLQPKQLPSCHNALTRQLPRTTSPATSSPSLGNQSNAQTTSTEPYKSSKTIQKPKVSLSPSTLQSDSSSPKPTLNDCHSASQSSVQPKLLPCGHNALTSVPCLRSQSITRTTPKKPEKSSEAIQKLTVLSSSETVQQPKVSLSPLTSLQPESSSPKPPRSSSKPTLSPAPFNPTMDQSKSNYVRVDDKGPTNLTYEVPEDIEALIKKDIMPRALKKPLSPSTYKDFFHAMLYAEDWYIEKWDGFEMEDVTLELEDAAIYRRNGPKGKDKKKLNKTDLEKEEDEKVFVAFEMDSVPLNRPFLISRDFASVRPTGSGAEPFQGIIYRVVRGNRVLVEFGEDFHSRHYPGCKYSVKFSFNRVCLKRAHQAIDSVSDGLFKNFLFPTSDSSSKANMSPSQVQPRYMDGMYRKQTAAVSQICSRHGPTPYLVEGPLCITYGKQLSTTGIVIQEAVLCTYRTKPNARILICAPTNVTCDVLVRSLRTEIPESAMFRANAAFRGKEEVLDDILPSCRISGECFSCPSLKELENFNVVSCTYMSCFRLHNEGLRAGHFSQMFMLDASSTTEPEALVALANFAHESTDVVVTGKLGNSSHWVRSPMARRYGLTKSYFERLSESELYEDFDPKFVCEL